MVPKSILGILAVFVTAACASLQGTVGDTKFIAISGKPTDAVPVPKTQTSASSPVATAATTNPSESSSYMPLLGQYIASAGDVQLSNQSRGFFYWDDPPHYWVGTPNTVPLASPLMATGVVEANGPTIIHQIDFNVGTNSDSTEATSQPSSPSQTGGTTGDIVKGIPLPGGGNLTATLGSKYSLTLQNVKSILLDLSNMQYVAQLANYNNNHGSFYIVSELLVADVTNNLDINANVQYTRGSLAPGAGLNFTDDYSGVGLVVGFEVLKIDDVSLLSQGPAADQNLKLNLRQQLPVSSGTNARDLRNAAFTINPSNATTDVSSLIPSLRDTAAFSSKIASLSSAFGFDAGNPYYPVNTANDDGTVTLLLHLPYTSPPANLQVTNSANSSTTYDQSIKIPANGNSVQINVASSGGNQVYDTSFVVSATPPDSEHHTTVTVVPGSVNARYFQIEAASPQDIYAAATGAVPSSQP